MQLATYLNKHYAGSLHDLAKEVGISPSMASLIVRGKRSPSISVQRAIAKLSGDKVHSMSDFFPEEFGRKRAKYKRKAKGRVKK